MQKQLTEGPLLDSKGRLIEAGFHTRLIKSYDKNLVKNKWLRLKEWDYYYVGNQDYGIALTVADNGYMTLISVSLLDYHAKNDITRTLINFLPFKGFNLPENSGKGDIHIRKKQVDLAFVHVDGKRHLTLRMDDFEKGYPIDIDLTLEQMNKDSMVIAVPFENPKRFYYNQKINLLKASGKVTYGDKTFDFSKDCLGVLDWGRGAWTYHNVWYWSSLSAHYENTYIGFNLGYGFGTDLKATENMLFVGEKTYKLEDVVFDIPKEDGQYDYLNQS